MYSLNSTGLVKEVTECTKNETVITMKILSHFPMFGKIERREESIEHFPLKRQMMRNSVRASTILRQGLTYTREGLACSIHTPFGPGGGSGVWSLVSGYTEVVILFFFRFTIIIFPFILLNNSLLFAEQHI